MHILHITQSLGGVERALTNIIGNIDHERFRSSVISPAKFSASKKLAADIHVIPIGRGINPIADFASFVSIYRAVKSIKPDIIHCHSAKGGFIGRLVGCLLGIPTVYTPHGFSFLSSSSPFLRALYLALERLASRWTSIVVACSESEQHHATADVGFAEDDTYLWKNTIDGADLEGVEPTICNYTYICSIGRPSYQKNIELQVACLRDLTERGLDVHFVLLGAGHHSPLKSSIIELIDKTGLSSRFHMRDWISHDEALNILAGSVAFVLTSRYEGLPLSVLEAMGLGKAIVATNVEGTKDCLISGRNALLVDIDDRVAFVDALETVIRDHTLRDRLGNQAKADFQAEYDMRNKINRLEEIYVSLKAKQKFKQQ